MGFTMPSTYAHVAERDDACTRRQLGRDVVETRDAFPIDSGADNASAGRLRWIAPWERRAAGATLAQIGRDWTSAPTNYARGRGSSGMRTSGGAVPGETLEEGELTPALRACDASWRSRSLASTRI